MNAANAKLRLFIIHASHHLTDHAANGDGLVAWGYIAELARRGHRIHAVTDRLDVRGDVPPNLTLVEIPRRSRSSALHYLTYMAKVRALYDRVAASEGVDVVHQMNPVVRGLSLALLGRRVPIVLGTYVGDWKRLRNAPNYRPPSLKKRVVAGFKAVLDALQQFQAARLALATPHALSRVPLYRFQRARIRFLHHGVDTELFARKPVAGDPAERPLSILFLGSVRDNKGATVLVDAFRLVAAEMPEAELLFVGSGQTAEMKGRLERYGLRSRAKFLGPLPREKVAGWLRACTVLCAPSFGEPYGQNILEAMASGKPVVGTTEGGHRHLLDSHGGYRIAPGEVSALAAALLDILRDRSRAERMGRYNRALVETRNAWPRVADELECLYRSAIAARNPGADLVRRVHSNAAGGSYPLVR